MSAYVPTHGLLADLPGAWIALGLVALIAFAGFRGLPLPFWTAGTLLVLWLTGAPLWLWIVAVPVLLVLQVPALRRKAVSDRVFAFMRRAGLLPAISETERQAIEAGDVWVDGELFSGRPDLENLARATWPRLREDEQAFLDGPVRRVCAMVDDWQVWQEKDLPAAVWEYLKAERFFGMIVPKQFGGLGFSATAHSEVVERLASRSLPLAITVMVPNSLGPAELLVHFGTDEQRKHYLPRLARGEEIPCFALTEPGAGSDAAAMQAKGVVFRREDGEICIRLSWDKRYITLAAIATVLGLAFQLEDPDNLLGKGTRPGITCALVPTATPGVVLGRRHDPLGVPFYNCPTHGEDVVVPLSAVIGGRDGVGRGWQMLMECLAAGRGISLPATSTGGAKLVARAVGAYAAVRKQFGLPIGRFEGIEEPLARIAGFTWLMDAARLYTSGGIDQGAKPPVVTAMAKYSFTELFRQVINDGMDVQGGAAISRGPNNTLAHAYVGTPISITVEGANILTRTLMVFGQGAIRCHPYAFRQIDALQRNDRRAFDRAFFGHVGHVLRNTFRAVLLDLSRGRLAKSPVSGAAAPYWRRLSWASAQFALLADVAMATLGGALKRKEKLTGRYADVFRWMYLVTAALRRFEAEGRRPEDLPLLRWACEHGFARIQEAFDGILGNLPVPGGAVLLPVLRTWRRVNPIGSEPSDRLGGRTARVLLEPGETRDRLTAGVFVAPDEDVGLARLEEALRVCTEAEPVLQRIKQAVRDGRLPRRAPEHLLEEAEAQSVIDAREAELVRSAEAARARAIAVDSFTLEEYLGRTEADAPQASFATPLSGD